MLSLKFEMNDAQARFMTHPYFHRDQSLEPESFDTRGGNRYRFGLKDGAMRPFALPDGVG
jgi:hypothetical protein